MQQPDVSPEILILSNSNDFSTDHVCYQLHRLGASYLRLNRDELDHCEVRLLPTIPQLRVKRDDTTYCVDSSRLKSIYFRAPVFLRDVYQPNIDLLEQLKRTQWASFIRNLTVFDKCQWINSPQATYAAEMKALQLFKANGIGLKVPPTEIANSVPHSLAECNSIAVKTIDAAVVNKDGKQGFIYTNFYEFEELSKCSMREVPSIFQKALVPKVDLRVTIIGDTVYAAEITNSEEGVSGDWRLEMNVNLKYKPIELPQQIVNKCKALLRDLDLVFGGVDLIRYEDEYYFVEVNPTGEWAWLMPQTGFCIDETIAKLLIEGHGNDK